MRVSFQARPFQERLVCTPGLDSGLLLSSGFQIILQSLYFRELILQNVHKLLLQRLLGLKQLVRHTHAVVLDGHICVCVCHMSHILSCISWCLCSAAWPAAFLSKRLLAHPVFMWLKTK